MSKDSILKYGFGEALATIIYIVLVATFFSNANKLFGSDDNVMSGIAALLLLVFSVAVMGLTIFSRSILWYLDGHKKEALLLLAYKMGFLFIMLIIILGILVLRNI